MKVNVSRRSFKSIKNGVEYAYDSFVVTLPQKFFSVDKHGEKEAERLAKEYAKSMETKLKGP